MASNPVYDEARNGAPFNPEQCGDVPILIAALAEATQASAEDVCEHLSELGLRRFLDEYVLI